ncbi:MAG: ABC transporter permease [Candidatus Brocadiia bacterium]
MLAYVARRLGFLLLVALFVSFLTFSLLRLAPGDPAELIAIGKFGENVTAEQVEQVRRQRGFDAPLVVQYGRWCARAARGDLGESVVSGRPVAREMLSRLPATMELAGAALLVSLLVGVPAGMVCAARRGGAVDAAARGGALLGVSVPHFWLALLLILVFSLRLGWLPSFGSGGAAHLILPAVTVGVGMSALTTRVTRSSAVEVLSQPYVRTARAKGLNERIVLWKHVLKNSLIPTVTVLGLQFGRVLEGAVIVETVFGRPGIGRLLVSSVFARDFAVVQGCVLLFAAIFVTVNLLVDVAYAWLDPRIHYGRRG